MGLTDDRKTNNKTVQTTTGEDGSGSGGTGTKTLNSTFPNFQALTRVQDVLDRNKYVCFDTKHFMIY